MTAVTAIVTTIITAAISPTPVVTTLSAVAIAVVATIVAALRHYDYPAGSIVTASITVIRLSGRIVTIIGAH